ncbi:T9SS type A sorting domain-containing protein [Flammeovirga agarivorans]|uniref:Secretion system C-terminal sorting domain-containing protein n=1 Tax=Flammeovirga agarivorans TaxID=2726742 RepID=A0A7X8SL08_9BACT|nr:T9SS type A sorting domain-containing protein [Flammeovirga agarivorans]NLR92205.1 hypothetical protein [Flammeovirga agarivorans]
MKALFISLILFSISNLSFSTIIDVPAGTYSRFTVLRGDTVRVNGDLKITHDDDYREMKSHYTHHSRTTSPYFHDGHSGYLTVEEHGVLIINGNLHIDNTEDHKNTNDGKIIISENFRITATDDDEGFHFENNGDIVVNKNFEMTGQRKLDDDDDEISVFSNRGHLLVDQDMILKDHVHFDPRSSHHYHSGTTIVLGNTNFLHDRSHSSHHDDDDDDDGWSTLSPHGHYPNGQYLLHNANNAAQNYFRTPHLHATNKDAQNHISQPTKDLVSKFMSSTQVNRDLPIELMSFTLSTGGKNHVIAEWATAQEINSAYFTLEKSYDQQNFTMVNDRINAAGNAATEIDYDYEDTDDHSNKVVYYRLTEYDLDGKSQSWIREVSLGEANNSYTVTKVFPDPADNYINIMMDIDQNDVPTFQLILIETGQVFPLTYLNNNSSITGKETLDVSQMNDGLYMLLISLNKKVIYKKEMIIQH